jgi:hypothetical protein
MVSLSNSMHSSNTMKPLSGSPGATTNTLKMSGGKKSRRGGSGRTYSGTLSSSSYLNKGTTDKSAGINSVAFLGGRRRKSRRSRKTRKSRRRRH